jgi:hypothetical protein
LVFARYRRSDKGEGGGEQDQRTQRNLLRRHD